MSAKPYSEEEVEAIRAYVATRDESATRRSHDAKTCHDRRRWLATLDAASSPEPRREPKPVAWGIRSSDGAYWDAIYSSESAAEDCGLGGTVVPLFAQAPPADVVALLREVAADPHANLTIGLKARIDAALARVVPHA